MNSILARSVGFPTGLNALATPRECNNIFHDNISANPIKINWYIFSFEGDSDYLTFIGTGDFIECKKQVESMFFTNCSHSSCGTLGEYQPKANGHYMVSKNADIYFRRRIKFFYNLDRTQNFCPRIFK